MPINADAFFFFWYRSGVKIEEPAKENVSAGSYNIDGTPMTGLQTFLMLVGVASMVSVPLMIFFGHGSIRTKRVLWASIIAGMLLPIIYNTLTNDEPRLTVSKSEMQKIEQQYRDMVQKQKDNE
jgi:hypothetical protein